MASITFQFDIVVIPHNIAKIPTVIDNGRSMKYFVPFNEWNEYKLQNIDLNKRILT